MKKLCSQVLLLIFVLLSTTGCTPEGRGFKLPEGNAEAGKATFVALACNDCHHGAGIERASDSSTDLDVMLGGPVNSVKTYGELVTSIINPSHRIKRPYPPQTLEVDGESLMRPYNSFMTVEQLVDLVTFLEAHYELRAPPSYL